MKFVRGDLRKLQTGLLVGLALIVIGGIGVYFGNDAMQTARRELAEAQATRNEADNQLRRMRGEEREIREKSVIFRQLEARGMVGEERRLEWSELLEAIRERRQLAGLRYEFGPQRPLDNTATMPTGLIYFVSPMSLQLDLLHEEDLTRLLADIRRQAKALIRIRSCVISRLTEGQAGAADPAVIFNLRAECRIDWITLRQAHAGEGRQSP